MPSPVEGEGEFKSPESLLGGIYGECPDNYEAIIMEAQGMEIVAADSCKTGNLRRVLGM